MKTRANRLKDILAEISRLEEQRDAAEAEAKRSTERLKELSSRKVAFTPNASAGDRGTVKELGALATALNEESTTLSHTKAVAEDAVRELDRLILEAEVRHREAEKRLARGRYEALREERYSLDGEAEEAMAALVEVLDRLETLHADQIRAATEAEDSSPTHQDPRSTIEQWLARRLRRWLSNGSLERYDSPLSELDPLARKPESDEER